MVSRSPASKSPSRHAASTSSAAARDGIIAGSVHVPYASLDQVMEPGGMLRQVASGKRLIFYCAYGERSALAVRTATDSGVADVCHLVGGVKAWIMAGGEIERSPDE